MGDEEEVNGFAEAMDTLNRKKKANEIAIFAMEKQIGRPPIRRANERGLSDWVCSICNKSVVLCEKYCDRCGQKIDWRGIRD